jgi:EF hand
VGFVAFFAAATLLRDVDPDMSGKISFEEFVRLLNKSRSEQRRRGFYRNTLCCEFVPRFLPRSHTV